MKKSFILTSFLILTGLALNFDEVLSQDVKEPVIVKEPVFIRSTDKYWLTGERGERGDFYIGQDVKSTRLNLSKHFEGESVAKTGTFMVEEGIRMLEIAIKGSVDEGQIKLSISKPGKNLFKEQVIDSSADVEWTQMFTIKEDNKEYTGEWTYKIEAVNAMGFYSLSITAH
jgi:hypothetical protein